MNLELDRRTRLDFLGAVITSYVGLPACRELDAALGHLETA
ncbi:MAG: hypothetical protein QGH97_15495 [Dehalococcoidia bacterium]|nr:hypothetical protein [Dehalococcoidia bacterium]MDP7201322.1 hypothetical protein [Dehalococcoidia bacterium]HJN86079.1 hypothetical protein [Dehalococcoidia bacterium]